MTPFVRNRNGMLMFQVIEYHNGKTTAFYFLSININNILLQMETLVSDFDYSCTTGNMVVCLYLGYKLGINLHYYNSQSFPVNAFAYGSDIVRLCCVVELKINSIVHVTELINVVETYLKRQHMVKLYHSGKLYI